MNAQPYDSTVKLNLSHNISSSKMLEVRFDLFQTVQSVKEQIEKRYGTDYNSMQLVLRDKQGNFISNMTNDTKFLGSYNPQDGYEIYVIDNNPNSILKGLEDVGQVQKYTISDEAYDALPTNMKKFKQQIMQQQAAGGNAPAIDDTYMEQEALAINIGARCQVIKNEVRGSVRYVGQVPQMGVGFFVGVQLDEPVGSFNGSIKGYQYFQCLPKYGLFLRPNEIIIGDFPEIELDEI